MGVFVRAAAAPGALLVLSAICAPAPAGPLHDAAKSGDTIQVERLVAGGIAIDERDAGYRTAMHWAAEAGDVEMVDLLAAKGANLDAGDVTDVTALHMAVIGKHEDVVRLLIARGAAVNTVETEGESPLDAAFRFGLPAIIDMLKGAGATCGKSDVYSQQCREAEARN